MSTQSPPVETRQREAQYGSGREKAESGRLSDFPMSRGEKAPLEEVVKSYDPEEGYLTRHEPTAADLIATEGAPYSEHDRRKYDPSKSILDAAKEFLFVADQAGDPVSATSTPGTVHLVWPDGSVITVRFEARKGELGAVSGHATEPERKSRNLAFERAREAKEATVQYKAEVRGAKQEKEASEKAPGNPPAHL
jgi:hypothetical protein